MPPSLKTKIMEFETEVFDIAQKLVANASERKESLSFEAALLVAAQIQRTRVLKQTLSQLSNRVQKLK